MDVVAAAVEEPITKSEFARRRHVTPGRVSQWIAEGKIHGPAIAGEGRSARVVESIACAQLRQKLDIGQRLGNGLDTRLEISPAPPQTAEVLPFTRPPVVDTVEDQIKRERLEQLQRTNRRQAEEDEVRSGRLIDAEAAAREMGRMAAALITVFEGALPEFALALAGRFQVPSRDVLHLLRQEFRKVREAAAAEASRRAGEMPALAPYDIDTPAADLAGEAADA